MAKPLLRVALGDGAGDFVPVIVQAGIPLLDKWNNNGTLLSEWLGRFVALAQWEAETVNCYLRDDDAGQLDGIPCAPATAADLRGVLQPELETLQDRLRKAVPQSSSARQLQQYVSQMLLQTQSPGDQAGGKCQFFKYRDLRGDWRLVWCLGYTPTAARDSWTPAICGNPECRLLTLVDQTGERPCPRCGQQIRTRSWLSRHRNRVAAALALLVLAVAGAYLWTRPDATTRGRVLRALDGRPVAGAEVRIEGTSYLTTTDDAGDFLLQYRRLSGRRPVLRVSAHGFLNESVPSGVDSGSNAAVEIRLTGAGQLLGRVVYAMGSADKPISGAEVALDSRNIAPVATDDGGAFQFTAIPPEPLRLRVSAAGFRLAEMAAEATATGDPPLRVVLTGDGRLSGQVVHARDESVPVANADVNVEGLESVRARTGSDGRFAFAELPPAPLQVWASATGYRRIAIIAESLRTPIRIPLAGDATLSGSVTRGDTGEPVRDADVRLRDTPFRTQTDEAGRFQLEGVPSGPARIVASRPGLSAQLAEELPAHEETSVAIVLTGGATIRGRVIGAADQRPVADATVAVAKTRLQAKTDSQGRFHLSGIAASAVTLQASAENYIPLTLARELTDGEQTLDDLLLVAAIGVSGQVVRAVDETAVADAEVAIAEPRLRTRTDQDGRFAFSGVPQVPIQIAAMAPGFRSNVVSIEPGTASVRIPLTGDAVLSGTVMRGDLNQPAAGAEVKLSGTPFVATADPQGRFRLEGVCSGPAQIAASLPGLSGSVASELPANKETTVHLVLAGGAGVRGRILSAGDQQPVAGATIAIPQTQLQATSDDQGRFSLAGIPAGRVTLRVQAQDHLPQEIAKELANEQQTLDDVALLPAATVSGVVVRALDDAVLDGAEVTVGAGLATVRTDRQGAFTISELPVGPATVRVAAPGYQTREVPCQLELGRQRLEPISLVGDTPLSGVTRDAVNPQQAVPKARVEVRVGGYVKPLTSDANGGFTVGDVPGGMVEVTAQAPGYRDAHVRKEVGPGDARIEVPMTRLIAVRGQVVEAGGPRRAVARAVVTVNVEGVEQTAKTGSDGGFTLNVPPGAAVASATAEGYCDAKVHKQLTAQDTSLVIPLVRGTNVRGTVLNAVTGDPLAGATVAVTAGGAPQSDVTGGDVTGGDGQFNVRGVPAGEASIAVTAHGFEPAQLSHLTGGNEALRIVLSPKIPAGEVRIVLTWDERPRDLDAHLYGPLPGGGQFHVGFKDLSAPGVTLDVDAKEGWGPETITARVSPGTYHYYVAHNDSLGIAKAQGLAPSKAQVRVYYQGAAQRAYVIPSDVGGPAWHALDIQVSQSEQISVVPRNQFSSDLPKR